MNSEQAKRFMTQLFHEIWTSHHLEKFDDYYHPDVIANINGTELHYDDIRNAAEAFKTGYDHINYNFQSILIDEDVIAARFEASMLRGGERVAMRIFGFYHLLNNKLHRIYTSTFSLTE